MDFPAPQSGQEEDKTLERIALAGTSRSTTRLGFGCSTVMGAMGRRDSLRVLEAAYDAGIRHFDVAPMYGYGEAEGCLGDLLQRHPSKISDVTVATKYGIPPARHSSLLRLGRRIAGPAIVHLPALKQRLAGAANAVATRGQPRPSFTTAQAAASLERSLAALRTGRIDLWLLHEVTASDLEDEGLLRFLEDQIAQGIIGAFGIGSSADKLGALLQQRPAYCRTLQYEWSILSPPVPPPAVSPAFAPFRIHHRALSAHFRALHAALLQNKIVCHRWSQHVDADLSDANTLARLMLKAALVMNPASIVLFSSKHPRHIHANLETADDVSLEAPSRRLYGLAQTEIDRLLPRGGQSGPG